jgi:hypothetical protein
MEKAQLCCETRWNFKLCTNVELISSQQSNTFVSEIRTLTEKIYELPHEPERWSARGTRLLELGYPELAVGDQYKALLLVQAALRNDTPLGETALLTFGMCNWYCELRDPTWAGIQYTAESYQFRIHMRLVTARESIYFELIHSLRTCTAVGDYIHISREAMREHPYNKIFAQHLKQGLKWYRMKASQGVMDLDVVPTHVQWQYSLKCGGHLMRAYPWMKPNLLRRDDKVLKTVQEDFLVLSSKCHVLRSKIQDHIGKPLTAERDVYGVFASKDLKPGETVLVDNGVTCSTSAPNRCSNCCARLPKKPTVLACCKASLCTTQCKDAALKTYHKVLCGRDKDLAFLVAAAHGATERDANVDNLLLLRILAMSLQEGTTNPLQSSFMSRLTPQYKGSKAITFSMVEHVVNPIRMLQSLGIDVFANREYDTWVIQTISNRISNNILFSETENEYALHSCLPAYSMFNHSCEPNVKAERLRDGAHQKMYAYRAVKKGQELFIDYNDLENLPKRDRQQALQPWLGGPCMCSRCKREK